MTFTGNLWVYSLFFIAVLLLGLGFRIYRRTTSFNNPSFAALLISISGWSVFYGLEIAASNLETMRLLAAVQYVFIAAIAPLWLLTSLILSEKDYVPRRLTVGLLALVPSITVLMAFTNDGHQLLWQSAVAVDTPTATFLQVQYGLYFWFHAAYSYLLVFWGAFNIVRSVLGTARVYQISRTAMLVGGLTPLVFNVIYLFGMSPVDFVDLSPFGFTVSALAYAYVYFQGNIASLHPVARSAILDLIPMGVILVNNQGLVLDANEKGEALLQTKTGAGPSLVGQSLTEIAPELHDIYRSSFAGSREFTRGPQTLSASVSSFQADQLESTLVIVEDVTTLKKTHAQLNTERSRLEEILDFLPLGVFELDTRGHFTNANLTGLAMVGYSELDIRQKNIFEILAPQDQAQTEEYIARWRAGEQFSAEFNIVRKDSQSVPVIVQSAPIDEGEALVGFRAYAIDLSEQKNTQRALVESQGLYKALLETTPLGILVATKDSITFCNDALVDFFGLPNQDTLQAFQPEHFILSGSDVAEQSLLNLLQSSSVSGIIEGTNFVDAPYRFQYRVSSVSDLEQPTYLVVFEDLTSKQTQADKVLSQ